MFRYITYRPPILPLNISGVKGASSTEVFFVSNFKQLFLEKDKYTLCLRCVLSIKYITCWKCVFNWSFFSFNFYESALKRALCLHCFCLLNASRIKDASSIRVFILTSNSVCKNNHMSLLFCQLSCFCRLNTSRAKCSSSRMFFSHFNFVWAYTIVSTTKVRTYIVQCPVHRTVQSVLLCTLRQVYDTGTM